MEEDNQIKETKKNNIYDYLKQGMCKKDSAQMVGIDESTFYRWIESDTSFASRVEASILEYKHTLIRNVTTCAEKDGRLALEILKRKFPKEWGDNVEVRGSYEQERKEVREWLQAVFDRNRELPELVQDFTPTS
jgi:hypothetical protein